MHHSFRASIIVPCKGRLHHLRQAAASMLEQTAHDSFTYDVIVVDYGCPDGAYDWCVQQRHDRLRALRVEEDVAWFNKSRCNNIGARFSDADVLAFLDVDKIPPADFLLRSMRVLHSAPCDMVHYAVEGQPMGDGSGERYRFTPYPAELEGPPLEERRPCLITTIVKREVWEAVRGFDEGFDGWGYEDVDFRLRAVEAGFRDWWLGGPFVFINHGASDSTRFYRNQDKDLTARKNLLRMEDRTRPINPHGFGV